MSRIDNLQSPSPAHRMSADVCGLQTLLCFRMSRCRTCWTQGILRIPFFSWRSRTTGSTRRIASSPGTKSRRTKRCLSSMKGPWRKPSPSPVKSDGRALRRQRRKIRALRRKKPRLELNAKRGNIWVGRRRKTRERGRGPWRCRRSSGTWCRSATGLR